MEEQIKRLIRQGETDTSITQMTGASYATINNLRNTIIREDKKEFNNFIKKQFESYNTPVEIKWIDKNDKLIGLFKVDDKIYQINCINKGSNVWTYKFYLYDIEKNEFNPELTNFKTGKLSVLSTIRKGMDYLINTKNPNGLIFATIDSSEGRKKLYCTYSKEIEEKYLYKKVTNVIDNKQIFILYKDIDVNDLMNIVEKIIEDEI